MAYLDKHRMIPICGREVAFCWTLGSMVALQERFGITRENFGKRFKEAVEKGEVPQFYRMLIFAGTQTDDQPPTLAEIDRMTMDEFARAKVLMDESMAVAVTGGLPAGKAGAADHGAGAGASGGTGGSRSSRRSTAAGLRRTHSGA